jgi:hypothetical protein
MELVAVLDDAFSVVCPGGECSRFNWRNLARISSWFVNYEWIEWVASCWQSRQMTVVRYMELLLVNRKIKISFNRFFLLMVEHHTCLKCHVVKMLRNIFYWKKSSTTKFKYDFRWIRYVSIDYYYYNNYHHHHYHHHRRRHIIIIIVIYVSRTSRISSYKIIKTDCHSFPCVAK